MADTPAAAPAAAPAVAPAAAPKGDDLATVLDLIESAISDKGLVKRLRKLVQPAPAAPAAK